MKIITQFLQSCSYCLSILLLEKCHQTQKTLILDKTMSSNLLLSNDTDSRQPPTANFFLSFLEYLNIGKS